jgi:hypothetical protein
MQNLRKELKTPSAKPDTRVRIPWMKGDTVSDWDETCIWAMEVYGLPGNKFYTHMTEDYMDFIFKDERDAIYFSLRWL